MEPVLILTCGFWAAPCPHHFRQMLDLQLPICNSYQHRVDRYGLQDMGFVPYKTETLQDNTAPATVHIPNKHHEDMEALQHHAARIAHQLHHTTPNDNILDNCNVQTIDSRLYQLQEKFITKCIEEDHILQPFIRQQLPPHDAT